jgi:hypothetical protein
MQIIWLLIRSKPNIVLFAVSSEYPNVGSVIHLGVNQYLARDKKSFNLLYAMNADKFEELYKEA